MKIQNKHYLVLPLLGVITLVSSSSSAKADNGYVTVPKKLQYAGWYHAPLEGQLVDERMRLKNFVQPDAPVENNNIAIPPYANGLPGASAGVKMMGSTLPQAGFSSQIPAGGFAPRQALPQTKMGGITPVGPARPIGLRSNPAKPVEKPIAASKTVTAKSFTGKSFTGKPVTAEYAQNTRPSSSGFSFNQKVTAEVRADLRSGK